MVTVDGDMSTNDAVFALANGLAANPRRRGGHARASTRSSRRSRRSASSWREQIAEDGDGATKLVEVRVAGRARGRHGARARAGRRRVDAGEGGDLRRRPELGPRAGGGRRARRVAHAGRSTRRARRCTCRATCVYDDRRADRGRRARRSARRCASRTCSSRCGSPRATRAATAWGCDLIYDYVKINADYTSLTHAAPDGTVARDDRLTNYSPGFKRALLVEALSYIARVHRTRARSSSTAARRW